MRLTNYFEQAFRKGSFIIKLVKLIRLIQHTFYFLFNIKIGPYPSPNSDILNIGFFDRNRLLHVQDEFRKDFSELTLYKEGEYEAMKIDVISLAKSSDSNQILLKKKYIGIHKYNHFYNELICLNRLSFTNFVPKIVFVNYIECSIYMEYIEGINVRIINRKSNIEKKKYDSENIINEFKKIVSITHDNGVLIYDLRAANMIISNSSFYLIDFADSLYFGRFISFFLESLKKFEMRRIKNELEMYIK